MNTKAEILAVQPNPNRRNAVSDVLSGKQKEDLLARLILEFQGK